MFKFNQILVFRKIKRLIQPKYFKQNSFAANYCTKSVESIQVCILGADTIKGQITAFLIKQNPLVSLLHLQGTNILEQIGIDLNFCYTKCKIQTYHGGHSVAEAVRTADVVLMLGLCTLTKKSTIGERIMNEGFRLCELAKECTKNCPKSVVIVCVNPVSVTLPIVSEIYKQTDWYHPSRIIGSAALAQIKADTIAAQYQNLDPQTVNVPILGGPDIDCTLPLFSRATPANLDQNNSVRLIKRFYKCQENCIFSEAVALNRMITTIALGLCGDQNAVCNMFVRSNLISICRYLTTTVKFTENGFTHNYGIPKMTETELKLFENIAYQLKDREEMAKDFLNFHHSRDRNEMKQPNFMVKEMEKIEQLNCNCIIR